MIPDGSLSSGGDSKRVGKADMQLRLERVEELLRACKTTASIQRLLSEEWQVTHRCVRMYITKVYEQWQAEAGESVAMRRDQRRAQLEGILELAVSGYEPDLKAAVAAVDRLCKIDGVFAPMEHLVHTPDGARRDLKSMTSAEKRNALAELFAKYAEAQPTKAPEGN